MLASSHGPGHGRQVTDPHSLPLSQVLKMFSKVVSRCPNPSWFAHALSQSPYDAVDLLWGSQADTDPLSKALELANPSSRQDFTTVNNLDASSGERLHDLGKPSLTVLDLLASNFFRYHLFNHELSLVNS
ncbi:hypothetical protein PQX77_021397 [Marasmius sp. AFHP31]|nr:hypothetical protein PQX77_021397 [Marasmius sp. AFHP31]